MTKSSKRIILEIFDYVGRSFKLAANICPSARSTVQKPMSAPNVSVQPVPQPTASTTAQNSETTPYKKLCERLQEQKTRQEEEKRATLASIVPQADIVDFGTALTLSNPQQIKQDIRQADEKTLKILLEELKNASTIGEMEIIPPIQQYAENVIHEKTQSKIAEENMRVISDAQPGRVCISDESVSSLCNKIIATIAKNPATNKYELAYLSLWKNVSDYCFMPGDYASFKFDLKTRTLSAKVSIHPERSSHIDHIFSLSAGEFNRIAKRFNTSKELQAFKASPHNSAGAKSDLLVSRLNL